MVTAEKHWQVVRARATPHAHKIAFRRPSDLPPAIPVPIVTSALWATRCIDVPILAARFILSTLTHSATEAPLLSMTLQRVLSWIITAAVMALGGQQSSVMRRRVERCLCTEAGEDCSSTRRSGISHVLYQAFRGPRVAQGTTPAIPHRAWRGLRRADEWQGATRQCEGERGVV